LWERTGVTLEAWFTLAVVVAVIAVFARDLVPPAVAMLSATVVLLVTGVIDAEAAFSGFSNPAPITVAALYVLARAAEVTGLLEPIVGRLMGGDDPHLLRHSHWRKRAQLGRLLAPTALASAFLNNTPIVAMVAPQVAEWANRRGLPSSPLLMPLSFAAIVGGVMTTIGTSTNLVVSGLLEQRGDEPLGMFEISAVGVPLALVGVTVVVLLAHAVLPQREGAFADLDEQTRSFSMAMRVVAGGPLDGRTVADAGLRDLQGVYLVQIERDGQVITPVAPDELLRGHDILTFAGKVDLVVDLQRKRGLASTEERHLEVLGRPDRHTFFEAVIGAESPLAGRTLKEAGFRERYQGAVVAIHRAAHRVDAKLGHVRLRVGDTLLILADLGFAERWRDRQDFLLVSRLGGSAPAQTRKAPIVALVAVGIVGVAGVGLVPIQHAALVGAGLLVLTRVLTPGQARTAVDLNVVVLIAAAFGVGAAITDSGLADVLGRLLVDLFAPYGELGVLIGVVLTTVVITELVTNNAAAVLVFPLAMSAAAEVGANPRGFAIAVAVAASASFLSPIGYQTNTMVYGLGGYRFGDFARLGAPLTVTMLVTVLLVVPRAWP
jgi:di/tricarboxylate transporter